MIEISGAVSPPMSLWTRPDLGPLLTALAATLAAASAVIEPTPLVVTSWYRDPERNARVGGNPRSQHLLGLAVDLRLSTPQAALDVIRGHKLTIVREPDHYHVQVFAAGATPAGLFAGE